MKDVRVGEALRETNRKKMWANIDTMDAEEKTRVLRMHADYDRAMALGRNMYVLPGGRKEWMGKRPYILPFGRVYAKWAFWDVENHYFGQRWLGNMYAIICKRIDQERSRPTRLIWSSGLPPRDSDRIGVSFDAYHDQTGKKLGVYEIVGLVVYDPFGNVGRIVGDVPTVKLSQSTYK